VAGALFTRRGGVGLAAAGHDEGDERHHDERPTDGERHGGAADRRLVTGYSTLSLCLCWDGRHPDGERVADENGHCSGAIEKTVTRIRL
jgi:hypothetical protein